MKKSIRNLLVIVPMKDLDHAKSRLDSVLSSKERRLLAKLLFLRTITILEKIRKSNEYFFDIGIVTKSTLIKNISQEFDVFHIQEKEKGLNQALKISYEWAVKMKYEFFSFLPADLADPDPAEILSFLQKYKETKKPLVALCPSDDMGTNAMLFSIPTKLNFSFGEKSFSKHYNISQKFGILPKVLPYASLRHDVDTWQDLEKIKLKR